MDLNLYIKNTLPSLPRRSCLNNMGPFESIFIAKAAIRNTGERITSPRKATIQSNMFLRNNRYTIAND